jgi:predicted nucleotidyltransferase
VFRLDRERAVALLAEKAGALLAARPDAIEVRLLGSLARGDAAPGSDADLFVLLRDGALPFLERSADLSRFFEGVGVGCDILAYTEDEWAEMRRRLVEVVEREGLLLAGRPADHPRGRPESTTTSAS